MDDNEIPPNLNITLNDPEIQCIVFSDGIGGDFMRISTDFGVMLNRRKFPHWQPDDFVKAFIDLIETKYKVKFIPREEK